MFSFWAWVEVSCITSVPPVQFWNQGLYGLEFFQRCEKLWYQEILRMITCWAHQLHSCRRDCGPRPEGLSVPFHEPEERKIFCFSVVLTNLKWKKLFFPVMNEVFDDVFVCFPTVSTNSRRSSGVPYLDEGAKKLVTCLCCTDYTEWRLFCFANCF